MRGRINEVEQLERSLSVHERALLDRLADDINRLHLTSVAMMFLESIKPLAFTGSQILVFFRPVVSLIWSNPSNYDILTEILERRGSVELLILRLEARF